jgi:two-component system response regulator AtoC
VFPIAAAAAARAPPRTSRPLADLLLARVCRELKRPALALDPAARAALVAAEWPGNVRELANVLERAAILCDGAALGVGDLWLDTAAAPPVAAGAGGAPVGGTLDELERHAIEQALAASGGNRRRAAAQLGIGLRTLYDKLKRYGLSA